MNNEIDKLKHRIAELEQQLLDEMDCVNRWPRPIPVSERLPSVGDEILGWCPTGNDHGVWYTLYVKELIVEPADEDMEVSLRFPWATWGQCYVTHWIPLPPRVQE